MNRSVIIALILAIAASLWVVSGSFSSTEPAQAAHKSSNIQSKPATELFTVRVKAVEAETMFDEIELQGEVLANRDIEIKSETHGTVASLKAEKGDELARGGIILNIATNDRLARLEQAKAQLNVAKSDLAAGSKLKAKRLLSQNQHDRNLANVVAAQATVKQIEVELSQTKITAAFAGMLDELYVEQGDYLSAGDPIARLVDHSGITIRTQVPQQHIAKLKLGQRAKAVLLDGTQVSATISYIASSADSTTRTFTVEAKAKNSAKLKRFGQSARVKIILGERLAHKLSPSYLDLDKSGGLRVKGVEGDRVVTHNVQMIRNEQDGVWLAGIPEQFDLITVGQGFVADGQQVKPNYETPAQAEAQP